MVRSLVSASTMKMTTIQNVAMLRGSRSVSDYEKAATNSQGYQVQYRQAVHQLQATPQVNLGVHNLKQGQENKKQQHQPSVPNLPNK
ncbi:hypothetical protein ACE6H2_026074 [Prunus campanulata]